ncbi:MAG TPA: hypothetical protein VLC46_01100 [Thermoanaerobaculia bacterium]|jgi:hypothetical protein|nr:hypothetical protein [Thermoanaerobaculia bacterium]
MKRTPLAAAVFFFAASCANIVHHDLILTFDESGENVTVAAVTSIPSSKDSHDHDRDERLREDILAGRDEWGLRFANANPESYRVTLDRERGELVHVERSARIDNADLQKIFFDVAVSAVVTRGDGWAELAIYPGTSTRATRSQRDDAEKKLRTYSEHAIVYFDAVRSMYDYLDGHPQRAEELFAALYRDDNDPQPPVVSDQEHDLVTAVRKSIDGLTENDDTQLLEAEADIVYNPMPARIVVRVPGQPLLVEGFAIARGGDLVAEPPSLLDAVASLEGRWVTPDPLAFALRPNGGDPAKEATIIATMPRRTTAVIGPIEVGDALVQKLRPAPRYRVRWIVKTNVDR